MATYVTRPSKKTEYPQLNHEARPTHLESIRGRLGQFVGGHYASSNLSALLFHHRLDDSDHVKLEVWSPPGRTKPSFEEAKRAKYKPAKKGDEFGPSWTNHWFKITLHIPSEWKDYERVQFEFDPSGEGLIFTNEGDPIHGLTGGYGGDRRVEFIIPSDMRKAGIAHFYIETSCNRMDGQNGLDPPDQNRFYKLNSADLCVPNQDAWRLMWDFDTLRQLLDNLPGDTPLNQRCMYVANEIMNVFQQGDVESIAKCRKVAEDILGEDWEEVIEKESEKAEKQQGTLWGVGHCHIDTAWLWPFSVTQQKSARSWSTQLDLMNRYPEHRFSATQGQQFKWLEELYPTLFDRLKARTAEGRFQPVGCTWVEMDTNMPSGEALCRQFLYGQRYFQSRFGFRSETFVLPDTFGYSSQLPQIARLSGAHNFFTQKLSWNNTNTFPHSTFNWVGLDSSQILTHMTPVDNYDSKCNIDEIRRGMTGNKNHEVTSQALLLFGNGDGGGGPTPPMLEKLRRARAVGKRHDVGGQLPLVKMGGSMEEFFDAVRKETKNGEKLPNWRGELYAEFHRGTYTSHGSIKKGNRKSEILMREAEYAATMASLMNEHYVYPKKRLDAAWEDLLLCQFHDVLPGSAIGMVYEDAEAEYAAIQRSITEVLDDAYAVLYEGSKDVADGQAGNFHGSAAVFAINTLPNYPRREIMKLAFDNCPSQEGAAVQTSKDGKDGLVLIDATDPTKALVGFPSGLVGSAGGVSAGYDTFVMANSTLSMTMRDGRIVSVFDKATERELIPNGMSGGMVIMEDHPNFWDAWDVDQFHLEKQTHLRFGQVHIVEEGPLRATLGASIQIGQTHGEIQISMDAIPASLKADARSLLRFNAVIDWREKHKFLKFELPLDISSENATYDTQFGVLSRPTHRNTSWDNAKFEVCGHKFADLSEYGVGVAILNDCKYGYSTEGNIMRLSLLRGPTQPDPDCDMGTHHIQWAIYPHAGTLVESDVAEVAYAFNSPMRRSHDTLKPASASPFRVAGAPNVMLETVKRGEDDEHRAGGNDKATVILRLFEQFGGHAKATLKIAGLDVIKAELVNILEDHLEPLHLKQALRNSEGGKSEHEVKLHFRGFEIKTVKLTLDLGKKKEVVAGDDWIEL